MRFTAVLYKRQPIFDQIGELSKKYINLPEAYLRKVVDEPHYVPPNMPNYLPKIEYYRDKVKFGIHRPWTEEFKHENPRLINHGPPVQPIRDWIIFKGDRVEVLVGKDRGKLGIVAQVIQERNWVFVEGLNWKLKEIGKTKEFPGTIVREEQPLLVTKEVALVDPTDNKGVKVDWRYTEDGEKVRVSRRTGRILPLPTAAEETYDYKTAATYLENPTKDTVAKDVELITFEPTLKTFEMDVMDAMGIKEDRVPGKSYWY